RVAPRAVGAAAASGARARWAPGDGDPARGVRALLWLLLGLPREGTAAGHGSTPDVQPGVDRGGPVLRVERLSDREAALAGACEDRHGAILAVHPAARHADLAAVLFHDPVLHAGA